MVKLRKKRWLTVRGGILTDVDSKDTFANLMTRPWCAHEVLDAGLNPVCFNKHLFRAYQRVFVQAVCK